MKIDSNSLLNTCLEIEGLLCLVSRRGNTVPDNVGRLLVEKAAKLKDNIAEFASVSPEEVTDEIAEAAITEEVADAAPHAEVIVSDNPTDNTVNLSEDAEETVVESQRGTAHEPETKVEEADDTELLAAESPAETETDSVPSQATHAESAPAAVRNDVAPVELTINDKFRFRRELFGNSDVDLAEALQIASQMSSVEEIEDYFYNDLCFNPADDTVKDFIRVVTSKH